MKKKLLIVLLVLLIATLAGIHAYINSDSYVKKYGETVYVEEGVRMDAVSQAAEFDRVTKGTVISLDNGWSHYSTEEWGGIAFDFPSSWTVSEKGYNENGVGGRLSTLSVKGEEAGVWLTSRGIDTEFDVNTYSTYEMHSGRQVKVYRQKGFPGFRISIGFCMEGWGEIYSHNNDREIADRIFSSFRCVAET